MKYSFILLLTLFFACKEQKPSSTKEANIASAEAKESATQTIYYFIRHAEKDRSTDSKDPSLTEKGQQRAENWAKVLKDKNIDLVYSSDFKRTIQTATPTANLFSQEVKLYPVEKLNDINFQKETQGKPVLVVGHSDTTPKFVNLILGETKYKDINDNNNSNLYKVVVSKNGKKKSKLTRHPL